MKIIKNMVRCKKCGDIIESKSIHDFKMCTCQAIGVDGGHDYLRRIGCADNIEDLSIVKNDAGEEMQVHE